MKIRIYIIIFLACLAGTTSAQQRTGSVRGGNGQAVEFATVALLEGNEQAAIAITDSLGNFTLSAVAGDYTMKIHNIAYQPFEQVIAITNQTSELGVFEMEESAFGLSEVVVTASAVTYEGDRFVMRINDTPELLNKDAAETLQLAPGVWVDDNGISINGTKGTKVFINEQELRLSQSELANYLRNFRSSDIARIEVIPQAGAEYSADSGGGVIKIILRKQLENGLMGNVMMRTSNGKYIDAYRPSATVNARIGKWTLNALASGYLAAKNKYDQIATRDYYNNEDGSYFRSQSDMNAKPRSANGRVGAIYEPDTRNSFGAEAEYSFIDSRMPSSAETIIKENNTTINSTSDYRQKENDRHFAATFNYIYKVDTIGSTLKLIADYTNKHVKGENEYHSIFEWDGWTTDSVYRSNSSSDYGIFSADIALNKQFVNGMKFSAGAKYTRNSMADSVRYESRYQSVWNPLPDYNFELDYTENIGALYSTFSANIGQLSITAGLRGEYSRTEGRGDALRRNYFDLFPNINLTYSFDAMRMFMLIGQYSRNIQRPNFWYLNPNRVQYSDYSYMVGNPQLRPTYINRFGITAVYKYRYVISVGGNLHKDLIREVSKTDPANKDVTYIIPENHHTENHYYIALSFPLKPAEWFNLNANLVGVKQDIRGTEEAEKQSHYLYFINATANFTLPARFYFELSYSGTSRLYSANSGIEPRHLFNASVKKQFFDDKITATLGINNIFNSKAAYFSDTERFKINTRGYEANSSRHVKFSIQYNFNAGKSFKKREIESASGEEKSRLEKEK